MTHIKTTYHPSGRYTCLAREDHNLIWEDLSGKLFGNFNRSEFYEAVEELIEGLQSSGELSSYCDQASELDGR